MADFREDTSIYPTMLKLTGCLCAEIADSGLPEPCFCGVLEGGDVAFDYCTECDNGLCGQAWVRLDTAYPSTSFPDQAIDANCVTRIAYTLEVGITRCAPLPDDSGNPPTVDEHLAAVRLQTADMQAMRRAIACCMGAEEDRDYVLGLYSPYPNGGGCTGGYWQVTTW